jgi:hypothetical protein
MTETQTRTEQAITETAEQAKREIAEDTESGIVPATVTDFSSLHDYVDANEYGGLCDDDFEYADVFTFDDSGYAAVNAMQDKVEEWLKAGRPAA